MTAARQTFYEVLGVKRSAKLADIERAYARLRADMQRESTIPDPRRAAMAKVAYATLSDPDSRAQYDESLGVSGRGPLRVGHVIAVGGGAIALFVAAWLGYHALTSRSNAVPGETAVDVPRLLEDVAPRIGRLEAALVSGDVRDLGFAVETAEGEMAAACPEMTAGTALTVRSGKTALRAEVASAKPGADVCVLSVKGVRDGVKLRSGNPPAQEPLQAVLPGPAGAQAHAASVARVLHTPDGPAFEMKTASALPNGTPIFDMREQLVALVVSPQELAPGAVVALPAARIAMARGASPAPAQAASSSDSGPTPPAGAGGETLVAEGFTTLWKESERNEVLSEVMDDVTKGKVGLPIAHWTRWKGFDGREHSNHCVVTYGPDDDVVADYEQYPSHKADEIFRFCALTRFQVDLEDLPVGDYHFTTMVDGKPVAEGSIRLERRIVTPGRLMVLVLVLGLALLVWVQGRR